jgi:bacillithiol biosynthesis cysteine-adding enzyme BshC
MSEMIVRTEPLGGSALSQAARTGQLSQWYRPIPRGADEWNDYARDAARTAPPTWFKDLEQAIAPTGRAATRLARAVDGQGLVVTTGQQPGLFGGPLMTLAKAISARALADALQAMLGLSVAPLFWAATDDADFQEAAVVSVSLDGGARELRLEARAPAGTPMARVPIDHDIDRQVTLLREACGSGAHELYLDETIHAYHDGATLGDAYVAVLRRVLEPLEMAVIDASHSDVARAAAPLMRRAANNGEALAGVVRRRSDEISAAGFTPQVEEVPGLSLVSLNRDGTKRRLPLVEAATVRELPSDQFLSPTVLLRPVLERAILPTAAYVGGPGEIAYFAQVTAVSDALGVPTPLVLPRWSTTIVEPRVHRTLARFGLSVEAFADPHAVEGRVARERLSPDAARALIGLRNNVAAGVSSLAAANGGLLPTDVIEGLRRSLEHRMARVERRLLAAVKRRETEIMHQIATARGSLYPHGTRQERKLAFVPFLARYGPVLIEQMLAAAGAHARALLSGAPSMAASSAATAPAARV